MCIPYILLRSQFNALSAHCCGDLRASFIQSLCMRKYSQGSTDASHVPNTTILVMSMLFMYTHSVSAMLSCPCFCCCLCKSNVLCSGAFCLKSGLQCPYLCCCNELAILLSEYVDITGNVLDAFIV